MQPSSLRPQALCESTKPVLSRLEKNPYPEARVDLCTVLMDDEVPQQESMQAAQTEEGNRTEEQDDKLLELRTFESRFMALASCSQMSEIQQVGHELRLANEREMAKLLARQADEVHSFMECAAAMVTLGARWAALSES